MALSISNTALKKIKCCFSKTVNPYTLVFQKHSVFEKQLIQTTLSVFQKMNSAVFKKQPQKQLIQTEPTGPRYIIRWKTSWGSLLGA